MSLPHKIDIEKKVPEKMHIEYKFDLERDIEIMDKINEILDFLKPQEEEKCICSDLQIPHKHSDGQIYVTYIPPHSNHIGQADEMVSTPKESWEEVWNEKLKELEKEAGYSNTTSFFDGDKELIKSFISKAVEAERVKFREIVAGKKITTGAGLGLDLDEKGYNQALSELLTEIK